MLSQFITVLDLTYIGFIALLFITTNSVILKNTQNKYSAVQKIHDGEIPRIGGILILFFFIMKSLVIVELFSEISYILFLSCLLCITTFPEDIGYNIKSYVRLTTILIISFFAIYLLDLKINTNIKFLDNNLNITFIKYLTLCFVTAAIVNGNNMIDGANGLCTASCISISCSLFFICYENKLDTSLILIFILLLIIFLIFNYPLGKIFLGDSGAYSIIFFLLIYFFYLNSRYEINIKYILIFIYPGFEVFFSIFRKLFFLSLSPFKADKKHLHLLVFTFLREKLKNKSILVSNNIVTILTIPVWSFPIYFFNFHYSYSLNIIYIFLFILLYTSYYLIFYLLCSSSSLIEK